MGNHGYRRAGNRIQTDHPLAGTALADSDLVANEFAQVLVDELGELSLGDPQQQDRLGVTQNANTGDDALGVHSDQRDHRLAGIGGDIHDISGQKYVSNQFTAIFSTTALVIVAIGPDIMAAFLAIGLDIRRFAHPMRKAVRAGYYLLAGDVGAEIWVSG